MMEFGVYTFADVDAEAKDRALKLQRKVLQGWQLTAKIPATNFTN
jgi:hypothetical protein